MPDRWLSINQIAPTPSLFARIRNPHPFFVHFRFPSLSPGSLIPSPPGLLGGPSGSF